MNTFAETETLLKMAIVLSQNSVKDIAEACGIKASTLYKWKTNQQVHLSPAKADALSLYFIEKEPETIITALAFNYVLHKLYVYLTSSTKQEVLQED